jgi:ATP-binding cassette, subfamily B, multidrug efflux pump
LKHLILLKKYFWRNKYRFFLGIFFTVLSNYFAVLSPQVAKYIINKVQQVVTKTPGSTINYNGYDPVFTKLMVWVNDNSKFANIVIWSGLVLVFLALFKGLFTYFMRQTLIVMSRHIEFDQKNDIFNQYQLLDIGFYKQNRTGDLMNRISEDVSKVRMFTGPAIMYSVNLITLISLSIWFMLKESPTLTLYTLAPLPLLAFIIFKVNTIINRKSELQQQKLSQLTSNAQESYSGIRVIKSYVQESALLNVFAKNSNAYKDSAISLAKTEAWYFPSIALLIGLSTLVTIMIGGLYHIYYRSIDAGTITQFVMYVSMLSFPVSSIGWVASIIQKASASQKRIDAFLQLTPNVVDTGTAAFTGAIDNITFNNVNFTYTDTNIEALKNINLTINKNEKIAIIGKTGCGKTTLAQLLLRMYNVQSGQISINNKTIDAYNLLQLRERISYVPQEVFLFSDTIANNIGFGINEITEEQLKTAATAAHIYTEIMDFKDQIQTIVGERGVTLSGGQKQRISIARALLKNSDAYIFDDCLSAVDVQTETKILNNLNNFLAQKTAIFITHRIFHLMQFDKIVVLHNGNIQEVGTHHELLKKQGMYFDMYNEQNTDKP